PWSWEARMRVVRFLAPHGYCFYLHAPKGDPFLRRRWREMHPEEDVAELTRLRGACQGAGVRFGVGLSPYEVYENFDRAAREALRRKLASFDELCVQDLAILFDDMRGDMPDLAERQVEIVHWALERTAAGRVIVCPTYYSDDPVLDRAFGRRPDGYLEQLGASLERRVEVFWTGEEVVSREISPAHLRRVAVRLGRKPFLWDNYPVNDGQRMSRFLHLRAFTGRPASNAAFLTAHGVNPALQPTLSLIPALTLEDSYRLGDEYEYGAAFRRAAAEALGEPLGSRLWEDILVLQDVGLDRLGEKEALLRDRYSAVDHPAAREIIGWLDGAYRITDEMVETQ
ncbi:MAG TPA: beta-N-acetylglucosaminidase domain-containing protein, partial [Gemmatimonadaceae bacterium]|nr:beta-N-acetylglucosaminidase domain-containing protein [Gemmatimonadaceae bacterium]